jgi:ribose transport system permease protein
VASSAYSILDVVNGSLGKVNNVLLLSLLLFATFFVVLRLTPTGRNISYVGSNIRMSLASGIDIAKTRNIAFVLAGVGAAVTGIMISCIRYGGDPMLAECQCSLTSVALTFWT